MSIATFSLFHLVEIYIIGPDISGSCNIPSPTRQECHTHYSMRDQEERQFTPGWTLESTNVSKPNISGVNKAFQYQKMSDLKGLPFWGTFSTYSGGGYVADLGTTQYQALTMLDSLSDNNWIDQLTRAVFLEFTTYNPNINLFSHILYLIEFPPIGAAMALPSITSFQVGLWKFVSILLPNHFFQCAN